MRALFSKIHNISFEKRDLFFKVILPLTLFFFVLAFPRFAFAWLGEDTIKNAILDIGRAFFSAGFWFVKMAVGYTTTVVSNDSVGNTWTSVRNISLEVFGIIILIIAFMNLMKLQIQTWGISRMIPKMLLAVFLIVFSKFFCISLINFSHALVGSILTAGHATGNTAGGQTPQLFDGFIGLGESLNNLQGDNGISLAMSFVVLIMCIIAFFVLLILAIALLFRAVFLAFLIIIAPFAIAMYVLPWTEKYMQEWLKNLVKWVFFFPICILILWVGMTMVNTNPATNPSNGNEFRATGGTTTQSDDFVGNWSNMLVAFLAIPLSVYFPLKLLGAVGQGLQDRMSGKKGIPLAPFDPKSARDAWGDRSKKVEKGKKERTARMMKKGVRPLRRLTTNAEGEQRWGARYISKAGAGDVPSKGDRMKARNAVNRYFGDDEQMARAAASYVNGDRTAYNALDFTQKRRFNRAKVAAGGDFKYGAVEHIKNRHEHIYSEHLRREQAAKAAYDSQIQAGTDQATAENMVVGGARFAHGDGAFMKQSKAAALEGEQKKFPSGG